jgi:tRNA U34 5-carboxymethylaminomethyl modifying enzyme MnmG/GidA
LFQYLAKSEKTVDVDYLNLSYQLEDEFDFPPFQVKNIEINLKYLKILEKYQDHVESLNIKIYLQVDVPVKLDFSKLKNLTFTFYVYPSKHFFKEFR